jgi:ribonuclease Z
MKLTTLGTGSPLPDPNRAGSAILVQVGADNLLFDCGRGVLMRLAAAGIPTPALLQHVFLTHLHSDHITDFNDLVTSSWAVGLVPRPLEVSGPVGTERLARNTLEMLTEDISYRIAHHEDLEGPPRVEVTELAPPDDGNVLVARTSDSCTVTFAATDHRPVHPSIGYRVEAGGRSVVIAGDTIPCAGLDALCAGAEVYVQTVIRPDLIAQIPVQRIQDIIDYHSSVEQAAQTAATNGVGTLVLTHPVPAPAPGAEDEWVEIAAAHFDGPIVLAHDLWSIELA